MPDRVIRDELLDSDRWLDLPADTDRLVYIGLLLICDDLGNLEGGIKRLYRFLHRFTQIKSEEVVATVMNHLGDADLIRRYEVAGREFWHVPRFRPHRQYLVRKCPASPWDGERQLGKERRVVLKGHALTQDVTEKIVDTSLPRSVHMAEGVGVGVGVGVGIGVNQKRTSMAANGDKSGDNSAGPATKTPPKTTTWTEHWKAKGKAFGMESKPGESDGDYCRRVQAFAKSRS